MSKNTLALIKEILIIEWAQFSKVNNMGGTAECQNNPTVFCTMRAIQAAIWQDRTLICYLHDLQQAEAANINLMTEKYAHMMATTHPEEFQCIKNQLAPISTAKQRLVNLIMHFFTAWEAEAVQMIATHDRGAFQPAAALTYLRSELLTYSEKTLEFCLADAQEAHAQGRNLAKEILSATLGYYDQHPSPFTKEALQRPQGTTTACPCGIETVISNLTELANLNHALMHEMVN